jgi:membrane protein
MGPLGFTLAVARRLREERALQTVGGLTYATLLSLVPTFAVALSIAAAFPAFDAVIDAAEDFVVDNVFPGAPGFDAVYAQISSFAKHAGSLTALGLAVFAVTALLLMLTVDTAMNRIFRAPRGRPLLRRVLVYATVLALGPVVVGVTFLTSSTAVAVSFGMLDLEGHTPAVLRALPLALTCFALTLLYGVVPAVRVPWWAALLGGVLAGLACEGAKRAFVAYLSQIPVYELVYGAFAAFPVFLIWLYASWLLVLVGAAFTALLSSRS